MRDLPTTKQEAEAWNRRRENHRFALLHYSVILLPLSLVILTLPLELANAPYLVLGFFVSMISVNEICNGIKFLKDHPWVDPKPLNEGDSKMSLFDLEVMQGAVETSILTGSHAYGKPNPESDIDLVVQVSKEVMRKLALKNELEMEEVVDQYGNQFDSACLRFGNLNLICVTNEHDFQIWKQGTAELVARKPVTREEAVSHFRKLRHQSL